MARKNAVGGKQVSKRRGRKRKLARWIHKKRQPSESHVPTNC